MTAALVEFELAGARVSLPEAAVRDNFLFAIGAGPKATPITLEMLESQPPRIGEYWEGQGGIYVGLMRGENGKQDYHLVVPTDAAAFIEEIKWGKTGIEIEGASHQFDGKANTDALVKHGGCPAAEWAAGLSIDGHKDFYLPARRELALCYANVPDLFKRQWHWSSTQSSADNAWMQDFADGGQFGNPKGREYSARAVRRFISNSAI